MAVREALADLFPITQRYAYLDHAAVAPLSVRVRVAIDRYLDGVEQSPSDHEAWVREKERIRQRVGALIGTSAGRIAFTRNTTSGLSLIAQGFDWRWGDNVVGVRGEFPANIYPWMALADRGVELRLYEPAEGRIDPAALLRRTDGRTRLIAISWVQFWNGFRSDLDAIGSAVRRLGGYLVVDGMQGLGALRFDFDRLPVDALAAGGNKWMLGPIGIGIVAIGERIFDRVRPTSIGTESVVKDREWFAYDLRLKDDARRFEDAAPNFPGILGLGAAVDLFLEHGPAHVEEQVLRHATRVRNGLEAHGMRLVAPPPDDATRSGIVSFRPPGGDSAALAARLRQAGIVVSLRGDFIRVSPHFYNRDADVDRLLDALPR